ncbi:hypothetical protein EYF80_030763 [Liparis tanakae]|uniref:SCP domain-containing protein n=1 Tax=Liparis tanakae TaxID=230148 RepID=A0A4Z2H101_9TELE|nr:hypothetical protein EYF80_030763 [Liparis tanakae]
MQQRRLLELQGSRGRWPPPRSGAPLWAWLLLGALAGRGAGGLLSEQQEELLELHNHYRGQVAPPASAMRPLECVRRDTSSMSQRADHSRALREQQRAAESTRDEQRAESSREQRVAESSREH